MAYLQNDFDLLPSNESKIEREMNTSIKIQFYTLNQTDEYLTLLTEYKNDYDELQANTSTVSVDNSSPLN